MRRLSHCEVIMAICFYLPIAWFGSPHGRDSWGCAERLHRKHVRMPIRVPVRTPVRVGTRVIACDTAYEM